MAIKDWPIEDRPREKLIERGPKALSDAELLAICLGSGVRGQSAVALGRELLLQAGGLRSLLTTPIPRLQGLGMAKTTRVRAALELARRCLGEDLRHTSPLRDPADTVEFLHAQLSNYLIEVFACVFLDNRNRVVGFEELFRGTVDRSCVYPREVVRACLRYNAAAVILAHNHPSGVAEPSESDQLITDDLRRALGLVGVRVLDHFIIGTGSTVSLAQRGLM